MTTATMKVTYSHKHPPYWEVTADDGRWWSVAHNQNTGRYLITNRSGRILEQHGSTGQKVLDTVLDHERDTIIELSGDRPVITDAAELDALPHEITDHRPANQPGGSR